MTRWLPIFIVFSSCIAAYDYYANPTEAYYLALIFLPLTILLTILWFVRSPVDTPSVPPSVKWQPVTIWQIASIVIGMACFVVLAFIQRSDSSTLAVHFSHQFMLWLLGLYLIAYGMSGGWRLREVWQSLRGWLQTPDARWLLAIVVLGFVVRVFALHSAFPNYIDEGSFARAVVTLREQSDVKLMSSMDTIANCTWIFAYLQYLYTQIVGANLGTLRVVSAIFGTLTILATYWMGRWAFNRRMGLLAAFLLAIDLPHLHFSRLGLYNIADPLFGVLAIAFLWRGLQTGSRRTMAFAGVWLGMTGYFYEGGRLLYPALIVSWLLLYIVIRGFHVPKCGIAVFLITTGLITSLYYLSIDNLQLETAAPLLANRSLNEGYWTEFFMEPDGFKQISTYLEGRINPPYLHIMGQPDGSKFYYSRQVGIILPHLLPFMLIGLGVAFFHWTRFGLILPMWMLLTILGNSLISDNNWTPRFVALFPALVLLIALGLDFIYQAMLAWWGRSPTAQRRLQRFALAVLLLLGLFHVTYYFRVMLPDNSHAYRQKMDDQDAAYRAQLLPPDTKVYILHEMNVFHQDVKVLQEYEQHTIPVLVVAADLFNYNNLDPNPDHPYAFFVDPKDTPTLVTLQRIFGDALEGPTWSPYNVPEIYQFALYQVDAS